MLHTKTIGNKIAEARKKEGLSQAELAKLVSISPQAVGKWERGESMPDILNLNRLAEIFGVDLNYFSGSTDVSRTGTPKVEPSVIETIDEAAGNQNKHRGWNLSEETWEHVDFSGLKLRQEKFSSSNFKTCKFIQADLMELNLKNNQFDSCDFSDSNIHSTNFQKSYIANGLFRNCSLKQTEFLASHLVGCDLTEADMTEVVMTSGGFEKNIILNTTWKNTFFTDTRITNLVFNGTIEDCSFEKCSFAKVTFQNAKLINTFFKYNNLKGVKFVDCEADRLTYNILVHGKADVTGLTLSTE